MKQAKWQEIGYGGMQAVLAKGLIKLEAKMTRKATADGKGGAWEYTAFVNGLTRTKRGETLAEAQAEAERMALVLVKKAQAELEAQDA